MVRILISAIFTGVVVFGCATGDDGPPLEMLDDAAVGDQALPPAEPGLMLAAQQRFPDIPLPANAREDVARTYVYEAPGLQIGRMVYSSRASVQELAQFYIRELPASDWHLESVTQAESSAVLVFTKLDKRLEVTVSAPGVARSRELVLHLVPAPQAGGRP
ncbi:MAG TPA: hypothetical protein PKI11_18605 [Candidatus Hydrogenedentes bacterium]|nr:hypothetical protein [Candidatus Hydrogenedentota bacterium]HNT87666.1 hypothetical protein [Candidatus Hydrogenedentota bacterium]